MVYLQKNSYNTKAIVYTPGYLWGRQEGSRNIQNVSGNISRDQQGFKQVKSEYEICGASSEWGLMKVYL